jgi:hypothetical protein
VWLDVEPAGGHARVNASPKRQIGVQHFRAELMQGVACKGSSPEVFLV